MTDLDPSGRRCVSLTVSADWGHFRRVDTTNDKQTYRVIPRTTVAGLLAAILGEPRDSYYGVFDRERSALAIVPQSPVRTMQVPMLTVPTAEGDIKGAAGVSGKTVVDPGTLQRERKRRSFEYLRDPTYRLHVVLSADSWMDRLVDRLDAESEAGDPDVRAVYTPSMGKTECLAEITESAVGNVNDATNATEVDSTIPEERLTPTTDVSYAMERTPAYMTSDDDGRHSTGHVSYVYPTDGGSIEGKGITAHTVNGDTVCFY